MILDSHTGHRLLFFAVPDAREAKDRCGKNRLYLDLRPREGTRDEELDRLTARGATMVADLRGKYGAGTGWVVLADPEGNEFCILSAVTATAGQASRIDDRRVRRSRFLTSRLTR